MLLFALPPPLPLPTFASPVNRRTHKPPAGGRRRNPNAIRTSQPRGVARRTMASSGGYLQVGRIASAAERKPCEQVSHGARPFISLPTDPTPHPLLFPTVHKAQPVPFLVRPWPGQTRRTLLHEWKQNKVHKWNHRHHRAANFHLEAPTLTHSCVFIYNNTVSNVKSRMPQGCWASTPTPSPHCAE